MIVHLFQERGFVFSGGLLLKSLWAVDVHHPGNCDSSSFL